MDTNGVTDRRHGVIYTRISKDDELRGRGVQRQEEDLRREFVRRGIEVAAVLSDNDLSGEGRKRRPDFDRLIGMISSGEAAVVGAADLDRLQRGFRPYVQLYEACEAAGAMVVWLGGQADFRTGEGILELDIRASFAREELRKIRSRITRSIRQKVEAGEPGGGLRAYGYEKDKATIVPEEAAVIRELVARVLAGESIRSLCRDLDARGVRTPRGGAWRHSTLRRALLHGRHAGLRDHHGVVVGTASWEPIITMAQRRALVAVLGEPTPRGKRPPRSHLLTGLMVCGLCGAWMTSRPKRRADGSVIRRYVCAKDSEGCGGMTVYADPLERMIATFVVQTLVEQPVPAKPPPDTAADVAEIEEVEERLRALGEAYGAGDVAIETMMAAGTALRGRLDSARSRVAAKTAAAAPETDPLEVGTVLGAWPEFEFERRARWIRGVVAGVIVFPAGGRGPGFDPRRVAVIWHLPGGGLGSWNL